MKKTDINKYIGNKIRELRVKKNITQEELAQYLDTTGQTISRYEMGERKTNYDTLFQLANYFKVSVHDFFPINSDNTANFLGDTMCEKGISFTQLSIESNISVNEIKRIYYGEEVLPKPSILIKLAESLNDEPYAYLCSSGYVDDPSFDFDSLYYTGIRYWLTENERKVLCKYVCAYWNKQSNKHIYTEKEVYNAIFDEENKSFSTSEVQNIIDNKSRENFNLSELVGKNVKKIRENKGLSKKEIASHLNIEINELNSLEIGEKLNNDLLFKLSKYFNVSIFDFFPKFKGICTNGKKLSDKELLELILVLNDISEFNLLNLISLAGLNLNDKEHIKYMVNLMRKDNNLINFNNNNKNNYNNFNDN